MARELFNVVPHLALKILFFPFYRQGHCGSEKLNYLPKEVHFCWWRGQESNPCKEQRCGSLLQSGLSLEK